MPEALNTFTEGMIMDVHPLMTPNNMLTNALNATIITFDGNEFMLQNDMGNGRVETAFLPSGYVPIGVKEHGGVIYIASFNPILNRSQLGCFPSPERNINSDELDLPDQLLTELSFGGFDSQSEGLGFKTQQSTLDIYNSEIFRPGDEFCISIEDVDYNGKNPNAKTSKYLESLLSLYGENVLKFFTIKVAVLDTDNKLTIIDKLKWFENGEDGSDKDKYIMPYFNSKIAGGESSGDVALDQYRKQVGSNYNVYSNSISGKIYLIFTLEGVQDFDFSIDITMFDKNNIYLSYLASSPKYTKNRHKVNNGKFTLDSIDLLNINSDLNLDNRNLNGAELRAVNIDILVKNENKITLSESGLIGTQYDNKLPDNVITGTSWTVDNGDVKIDGNPIDINDNIISGIGVVKLFDNYITQKSIIDIKNLLKNPYYEIENYELNNDGTLKNTGNIQLKYYHNKRFNDKSGILTYMVEPTSDLSRILNMKRTGQLDFSKIGSGELTLDSYKYYRNENNMTLSYAVSYYPTIGTKMNNVYIDFYDISGDYSTVYKLPFRQNWFGSFQEIVQLTDESLLSEPELTTDDYSKFTTIGKKWAEVKEGETLSLKKDNFYAISFIFEEISNTGYTIIRNEIKKYRFLYTTRLMNLYYTNRNILDFENVTPEYKLSTNKTQEIINENTGYEPDNNKYSYNSNDFDYDSALDIKITLTKNLKITDKLTLFTELLNANLYFGNVLKDTVINYDINTIINGVSQSIEDKALTIKASPEFNENYKISGVLTKQLSEAYKNLQSDSNNFDVIVTEEIKKIPNTNSYEIKSNLDLSFVKRFLIGDLLNSEIINIAESKLRPYWEWNTNSEFNWDEANKRILGVNTLPSGDNNKIPVFVFDGNCVYFTLKNLGVGDLRSSKNDGTISGGLLDFDGSAGLAPPHDSNHAVIRSGPSRHREYIDEDLVFNWSADVLKETNKNNPDYKLPSFILLYIMPKADESGIAEGISFNGKDRELKSNMFVYGMLTREDKYIMLNHIWLTSMHSGSNNYNIDGPYHNRWALMCLTELLKHLYVSLNYDKNVTNKYALNIIYSMTYDSLFKLPISVNYNTGSDLFMYNTNFPISNGYFCNVDVGSQIDSQHGSIFINWEKSWKNIPKHITKNSQLEYPYIYQLNSDLELLYKVGKDVNSELYLANFKNARPPSRSELFGDTINTPDKITTLDIFGNKLNASKIYFNLGRSGHSDSNRFGSNDLENRWGIRVTSSHKLFGIPSSGVVLSENDNLSTDSRWKDIINKATIYDKDVKGSGNCYVCVDDLSAVATKLQLGVSKNSNGDKLNNINNYFFNSRTSTVTTPGSGNVLLFGKERNIIDNTSSALVIIPESASGAYEKNKLNRLMVRSSSTDSPTAYWKRDGAGADGKREDENAPNLCRGNTLGRTRSNP